MHDRRMSEAGPAAGSPGLVSRFRQMVARCFEHHCSVESYARCLNVSADHLRVMVKKQTGRAAGEIISERVALERRGSSCTPISR